MYDLKNLNIWKETSSNDIFRYKNKVLETDVFKERENIMTGKCQAVFDEFGFALENGGFAVADIDAKIAAYQAALDEAGYQKILAEFQKQYDAWKK